MTTVDELAYYCQEENTFGALMFTGKWGCGKTYLVDHDLERALGKEYIIIRISLFGESSVESIHRKVKEAYFQEVILNIGENVDSGRNTANIGDKIRKFKKIYTQMKETKFGKVLKFALNISKKFPGVGEILSLNPVECISVENTIGDKKLILVFDDLERASSEIDEVDILGCINEYCENKNIKTIIIANEEKIISKSKEDHINKDSEESKDFNEIECDSGTIMKIKYSEIKEKIVLRTVHNKPDYERIIKYVIDKFQTNNESYKVFLNNHNKDLVKVFNCASTDNIRSVKYAIQDFERLYDVLKRKEVDENNIKIYFQTFLAYVFFLRAGKINKSDRYGYLSCDLDLEENFHELYNRQYMPVGVRKWLMEEEWDEKSIQDDIDQIIEINKNSEPKELVKKMRLIDLEENTIEQGFSIVLKSAYDGELEIDDYINLILNFLWARKLSYKLPESPNMDRLSDGVDLCLDSLCNSDDIEVSKTRIIISEDCVELLTKQEKEIYDKIFNFRDKNMQMYAINKRKYIKALKSENLSEIRACENKRFNDFDEELAKAVYECYKGLKNIDRNYFIDIFKRTWRMIGSSQDLMENESIDGFHLLKEKLERKKEDEEKENSNLKAAITGNFIKFISDMEGRLKAHE